MLLFAIALPSALAQASAANVRCLACHSAPGLSKKLPDRSVISLHVDETTYRNSAHGNKLCVDCHTDPGFQAFPHKPSISQVKCSSCHFMGNGKGAPVAGSVMEYADSVHGRAAKRGDPDAPKCKDCHGSHDIRPPSDPKSSVFRSNVPATCGKCHSDVKMAKKHKIPAVGSYKLYKKSVHGRIANGHPPYAVCTDCHGAHTIQAAVDPMSTVNKKHIPTTCGKCHKKIFAEYQESVHGRAIAEGEKDAPVCTNCHGEHNILPPGERKSSVYPTHVVATCSKCHEDLRIQRQYGLPANRLGTYIDSYHGIANEFGETTVANCATCHGSHLVLPSKNLKSTVNKANLPATCGKCHPGAGENFAKGTIHVMPSMKQDPLLYWIQAIYRIFVCAMIASFVAYIALDLIHRRRARRT